jgi:hypothetical protein
LATGAVQNYGLWIQSGAIVISAVGVIMTITANQRIARRRATIDLILLEQTHQELLEARRDFIKLRDAGHLVAWADPAKSNALEVSTMRTALNRYEIIAIGIRESTLNGRLYKRWLRTTVVKDWIACKPFVMQLRQNTQTPSLYCEYEWLAKKWALPEEKAHV